MFSLSDDYSSDDSLVFGAHEPSQGKKPARPPPQPPLKPTKPRRASKSAASARHVSNVCDPFIMDAMESAASLRWLRPTDAWRAENCACVERILRACDKLSQSARTDDETCQIKSIIRTTMAMQDRYLVEVQTLKSVAKDEIRLSYKRTCELVEHLRSQQQQHDDLSDVAPCTKAIEDMLQVRNLLRGLHPHTSYAHRHPNEPSKVDLDSSHHGVLTK